MKTALDKGSLDWVMDATREIASREEAEKQRDIREGRRSEIDDLPTGHPLRAMMEEAKRRHEEREALMKQAAERREKVKVARKAKAEKQEAQHEAEHRDRKASANQYNAAADALLSEIGNFLGLAESTSKEMTGFPGVRVKLMRVARAMSAAAYALRESRITAAERG